MIEDQELFQKKKRWLSRYRYRQRSIKRLENRLYEMDLALDGLKASNLTGMPSGGLSYTLNDQFAKKEELENRINRMLTSARQLRIEICNVLDQLDNEHESELLELYFIEDHSFVNIATDTAYSYRQVMRLYRSGMNNIIIPEMSH